MFAISYDFIVRFLISQNSLSDKFQLNRSVFRCFAWRKFLQIYSSIIFKSNSSLTKRFPAEFLKLTDTDLNIWRLTIEIWKVLLDKSLFYSSQIKCGSRTDKWRLPLKIMIWPARPPFSFAVSRTSNIICRAVKAFSSAESYTQAQRQQQKSKKIKNFQLYND